MRVVRALSSFGKQEEGTVAATAALCMVLFVGSLGLVIDTGMLYVQRTQLQKAVDAAALAAAYDIGGSGNSDADAVTYAVDNQVPAGDIVAAETGSLTVTDGPCAANGCPAYKVTAQAQVPFFFAPILGFQQGTVKVTATAINSIAQSFNASLLMPWGVWGGNNFGGGDPLGLNPGDQAIFRINDYNAANVKPNPCDDKKGPPCNPNWKIIDNAYKGYFHDFVGTVTQDGTLTDVGSKGGNACGQEPIDKLTNGTNPKIFPVIGTASGRGGNNSFTIIGFVALKVGSTDCGGSQMDGRVVKWTTWQATPGGTQVPGLPSVTVLKLWR